jgi:N-acetylmuramoyl-L-alanine amidase
MKYKYIIDYGHGLNTNGKRSPRLPGHIFETSGTDQFIEYDFNCAVFQWVMEMARAEGLDVATYERTEIDVPIAERRRLINALVDGPDCCMISIHANAAPGTGWSTAHGAVVLQHPQNVTKRGDFVASRLLHHGQSILGICSRRGSRQQAVGVCRVRCPAVLYEAGFFTHQEQAKLLDRETMAIACIIVSAMIDLETKTGDRPTTEG